ncbi:hypothetical protein A5784_25265 [Mycobacterium sp. 852013-50091_SCH5140682]|nr:hypothetical protein A5784_25265 [Mycobacterium sp. 852013-50091_SCH5140682]
MPGDIARFGSYSLFNPKFRCVDDVFYYGVFVLIFHIRIILHRINELIRNSHNFDDLILRANNCVVSIVKELGCRVEQSLNGTQLADSMIER